jgi:hypothetical protein
MGLRLAPQAAAVVEMVQDIEADLMDLTDVKQWMREHVQTLY